MSPYDDKSRDFKNPKTFLNGLTFLSPNALGTVPDTVSSSLSYHVLVFPDCWSPASHTHTHTHTPYVSSIRRPIHTHTHHCLTTIYNVPCTYVCRRRRRRCAHVLCYFSPSARRRRPRFLGDLIFDALVRHTIAHSHTLHIYIYICTCTCTCVFSCVAVRSGRQSTIGKHKHGRASAKSARDRGRKLLNSRRHSVQIKTWERTRARLLNINAECKHAVRPFQDSELIPLLIACGAFPAAAPQCFRVDLRRQNNGPTSVPATARDGADDTRTDKRRRAPT